MKKTSKLFGAVSLSAALALGCAVPAFAADHDSDPNHIAAAIVTDDGANGLNDQNVGTSKVQIAAEVGQLNATIPLKVKVVATTTGGNLLHVPAGTVADGTSTWTEATESTPAHYEYSGFYRIENHSTDIDIRVVSITAAVDDSSNWEYSTTGNLTSATTVTDGKQGAVNLAINGQTIDNGESGSKALTGDDWKINKYNSAQGTHSALGLLLSGSTSALSGTFVNGIGGSNEGSATIADTDDVVLTYTIQIA